MFVILSSKSNIPHHSSFLSPHPSPGWWNEAKDVELRERERAAVLLALETAENKPKPPLDQLVSDWL